MEINDIVREAHEVAAVFRFEFVGLSLGMAQTFLEGIVID